MGKSKKPTEVKKVTKTSPSSGSLASSLIGGLAGHFLQGYGTNLIGAAGGSVKKTTIKKKYS